ncbi:alpha-2-macroglobulin family protein [Chitinophaga arvensicola]|uniref:TonB-dependent outer membrane receptor, SusC/RagA subfamily, signature region n=1 Tax=Chitinophaga arvensicola TaxID=29529 RepID=A0A1I0SAU8_9BACT|nr:alpha-2-macroglobulin family protein [Chitinophaga arvensicola]SEW52532.1 TonB-dependent outer membrane receptor, SusC/RagA subfamily, signature region [Chitinophaga arvensicola]
MKRFALFLLCLWGLSASAQQYVSRSNTRSEQRRIYKISDKEALEIFRRDKASRSWADEKLLHTFTGSYPVGISFPTATTAGNYVVVTAVQNKIQYEYQPVHNVTLKVVSNNYDLAFLLHDKQGTLLSGANVQVGRRNIPWDPRTKTYRLPRYNRNGIVQVSYKGVLNIFDIGKPDNYRYRKTPWWKKIFRHRPDYYHYKEQYRFSRSTVTEKKYKGYMAFSKPWYKPGDTVRMKAFVVQNDTKPVNEPLLLRLYSDDAEVDTILTILQPYRPGGYNYEMVLNDSLDLDLDSDFCFTLETTDSRQYTADGNETDLSDDEYLARRKVLMRGSFNYEEYELKSVHFTARTDVKEHTRGTPVSLYLKATDENELPVMDGRVTITVTSGAAEQHYAPVVFVPKQLWKHEVILDMTGETKVTLPDSIFPAASLLYNIDAQFLNSNNESQEQQLSLEYKYPTDEISFTPKGDSVTLEFRRSGKSIPASGTLLLLNAKEDTVASCNINLPAVLPVHPYVNSMKVLANGIHNKYQLSNISGAVLCNASRTSDSVFAEVVNPNNLYFWYSIFAGNKLVAQGYDRQLSWKAASTTRSCYFVALQYIWNDNVKDEHFIIPLREKQLQVVINNPLAVFPGQTARIGITVTDVNGRPVKDADITAYAMTARFDYTPPSLPGFEKNFKMRKAYSRQRLQESKEVSGDQPMNWDRWRNEMALDTNAYYRFLHPDGIRYSTEPAKNGITQLSPFVLEKGVMQFISHVKIDEQPVFFANTDLHPAYSFAVTPGPHKLEIRTFDKTIIIDSVYAAANLKTYISIATDKPDARIKVTRMEHRLTPLEMNLRKRYLVPFEVNNGNQYTYINQSGNILWFNTDRRYGGAVYLAGPLKSMDADYIAQGNFTQLFQPEPGYTFNIRKGLVKQRSLTGKMDFPLPLYKEGSQGGIYDHVITENEIDSIWNNYQDGIQIGSSFFPEKVAGAITGQMMIAPDTSLRDKEVRQLFLYRYDNPAFIRIYSGNTTYLDDLEPGIYRLLVLLKKKQYYVADSLKVKQGGYTFYQLTARKLMAPDSTSDALARAITDWKGYGSPKISAYVASDFTLPFNNQYLDEGQFTAKVRGVVTDGKNPLPGVTITLKGTRHGTVTNAQGRFELPVTANGQLRVAFVGYETEDIPLDDQSFLHIKMKELVSRLDEVVVVGYGMAKKSYLTASISSMVANGLQGTVAGVKIRGASSFANATPLIIIDGIPYEGFMNSIDPSLIKNMSVLKDAAAVAIYGARAANGVILITSSKAGLLAAATQGDLPVESNSLRSNFRDDAFWQPRLRTNEKGEASFKVTFPDDITNWKTYALAFTDQGQTGSAQAQIKSFKPLSANLTLPAFVVAGDSINVIGKVLNYEKDSTVVTRSFYNNHVLSTSETIGVRNSRIDTFPITVPLSGDSISFKYTINRQPDYFDGEYRAIPVFEKGVKETTGLFAALSTDTSFQLQLNKDTGTIHLYASTGILPVLLDEVEHLQRYEYLCNEQLASKLTGLLLEKQARKFLGQPFTGQKKIADLISKLEQNRNKDGGWGWWNKSASVYWITQQVVQAMLLAEQEKYQPAIDKAALINYDVFLLNVAEQTDKLTLLETLYQLGAKVNFPAYLDTLHIDRTNTYDQYRLLYLKQRTQASVSTAALLAAQQTTMMGNAYWGEESYHLFRNNVQLTLLAYKILRQEGGHDALLRRIRSWFMEKRQSGNWRNTYESAEILATILPDVMETSEIQPPVLRINGQTVTGFPYNSTLPGGQPLQISKQGGSSVYFTAWQQHWNPAPLAAEHQFSVNSHFVQKDTTVKILTAGQVATLEVTVDVKADADYIMVEIPIPAGCSYDSKNGSWQNNEVHREHFKNKVSIFCNHLNKGKYRFNVALMPRYSGYYHLNPAKAEMMYFPVFYGREGMKKVIIKGK